MADMQQWRGPADAHDGLGRCVVTIGMFDGVHLGHQRIFSRIQQETSGLGLRVVLVRPGSHPPVLCSARHQSQLLTEQGVDAVWTVPFTPGLSLLGPDEFVHRVLVNRLHASHVVVGKNFRFGQNAAGDLALLERLGDKYGFKAVGVPLVARAGTPVSTTGIRAKLAKGDVLGAARDLGRPHGVEGAAVRCYQRGSLLDFPMADVDTLPNTAIPAEGVYAGWLARIDPAGGAEADRCQAVLSIGEGPATDKGRRVMQAYVLDRDNLDVCGEDVAVEFIVRLRPPMLFPSIDRLVKQIRKDAADARQLLIA